MKPWGEVVIGSGLDDVPKNFISTFFQFTHIFSSQFCWGIVVKVSRRAGHANGFEIGNPWCGSLAL